MTHTAEYQSWANMKNRCLNRNNHSYTRYGGRGIKVCDRWLESFENFEQDMGKRPSITHTLDRIDNGGDYSPSNCRWATKKEQANNTRRNRLIEFGGITKSLSAWAEQYGIPMKVLHARIVTNKWSIATALQTPVMKQYSHKKIKAQR